MRRGNPLKVFCLSFALLALGFANSQQGQGQEAIKLWPQDPPGIITAEGDEREEERHAAST